MREVTVLRLITARERYYRWDEGTRKTFTAVQATVPGLRRLIEGYVVEPTPTGSRLVWTLAIEPHPVLRPFRLTTPLAPWTLRGVAYLSHRRRVCASRSLNSFSHTSTPTLRSWRRTSRRQMQ